jgi:hypothetical protein
VKGRILFAKIFSAIYDSSIVEDPEVRFTFMDLLVLADMNGVVDMTYDAIARRTNRPVDIIRSTIARLEAPDPQSRTPDAKGARLQRLDEHREWGWFITNYDHFHKIASEVQRREKTRVRVARFREKLRGTSDGNAPETLGIAPQREKRHTDIDTDIEANTSPQPPKGDDASAAGQPPKPKAQRQPDLHAEAFAAAFDARFPEKYKRWNKADFVQLAAWRKGYPDVTPERFVAVAKALWGEGTYCPGYAFGIKSLCAGWAKAAARVQQQTPTDPLMEPRTPTEDELAQYRAAAGQTNG